MEDSLLIRGQYMVKLYNRMFEPLSEKYSLTKIEIDILLFLANNPGHDTAKDIIEMRFLTKSHVSMGVDELTKKKWLTGIKDGLDRRCTHLCIEKEALPIVEEAQSIQKQFRARLMDGVSEEEKRSMEEINQKIFKNVRNALECI